MSVLTRTRKQQFGTNVVLAQNSECREWTGTLDSRGYGVFEVKRGVTERAYKVAWLLKHDAVPEGASLRQTCGNRLCVNPNHINAL